MVLLVAGLALLMILQRLHRTSGLSSALIDKIGLASYWTGLGAFALAGVALVLAGKAHAGYMYVWLPPAWLQLFVLPLMFVAFVCIAAEIVPSNLRRFTHRPFLWGVVLWAVTHLLVKGDLAAITMFGGFGLLALLEIGTVKPRGTQRSAQALPWTNESLTVAVGGILFIMFFYLHADLFGASPSMMGSPFL